jgi:hypothetical protein
LVLQVARETVMSQKETTTVRVNLKFVRNLGNYESVHVELGVEDFVRDTDGNVDSAMNRVYSFVESKLMEKVQEIEQDLKK